MTSQQEKNKILPTANAMRILVVDDCKLQLAILKDILSKHGEVNIIHQSTKVLDIIKKASHEKRYYDLIILDIVMPEITGLELLKKIRGFEIERGLKNSKIIMATSLDSSQHIKEAFFEDADEYIIKPVTKERVYEAMRNVGLIDEV